MNQKPDNKYSCETCGWWQIHRLDSCDIVEKMSDEKKELIKTLGCASHTLLKTHLFNLEFENERLRNEIKTSSTDETILDSFKIEPNGEGNMEVEMISHGGAGHKMLINWVNFYEANGGKNYFTTTLEGTIRGERKRYEITIRDLANGNKSPAETINELKEKLKSLEK